MIWRKLGLGRVCGRHLVADLLLLDISLIKRTDRARAGSPRVTVVVDTGLSPSESPAALTSVSAGEFRGAAGTALSMIAHPICCETPPLEWHDVVFVASLPGRTGEYSSALHFLADGSVPEMPGNAR